MARAWDRSANIDSGDGQFAVVRPQLSIHQSRATKSTLNTGANSIGNLESGGLAMSRHRLLPRLIVALAATAGVVFVEATLSKAQDNAHANHAQHMHAGEVAMPTMPGQDAFGTIQEIVRILEADPTTDWSKVNIGALREHLIDMNEVTLRAAATERPIDKGIEFTVTGEGRTRDAIKRMVPAHAHELNALGWKVRTEEPPNGVKLIVTSTDPKQVTKLKALGFMGIMAQGAHHQLHHLMMARGEFAH
jgi:hypothetical protein